MNFLKRLRNAGRWLLYFANTAVFFCAGPLLRKHLLGSSWEKRWRDWRRFSKLTLRIFQIKLKIEDPFQTDLDHQYIVIANHRSWFDQIALGAHLPRPFRLLSKKGYLDFPIFGHAARAQGVIPVTGGRLSAEDAENLLESLKSGQSVVMFPEGTRGSGPELLPFKSGAFRLSSQTGVSVLPIFLLHTEERLSKRNSLLTVKPGAVTLVVGRPQVFSGQNWESEMTEFEAHYRRTLAELNGRNP